MAGEITARELPDIPAIVCRTVRGVGYTSDYEVEVITHDQSGDISKAVEQERLLRSDGSKVSLLGKYNFIEQDAKQLCRQAGLLSPVYEFTDRGGVAGSALTPSVRSCATSTITIWICGAGCWSCRHSLEK